MVQTPAVYCIVDNEVPNISNHQPCDRTARNFLTGTPTLPPPFPRLPRTSRARESPPKALPRDGGRRAIPPLTAPEGGSRKPRTAPNERSLGGLNWDNRRRSTAAIELSPKPVRDKSPSHARGRGCWRPISFVTFLASFLWACL